MAVGLPYVLHNLIPTTDIGERVAVSSAMWRKTIDCYEFCEGLGTEESSNGMPTLMQVDDLGRQLQNVMNELKQWLHANPDVEFEGNTWLL
jgi:hypothetical protein